MSLPRLPIAAAVTVDRAACGSPAGAEGLIFLHNKDVRTTTISTTPEGQLIGLRTEHSSADIARAVMEGFGYLLKWSSENRGIDLDGEIAHCAGGGARSAIWRQIVSDITGLTQLYLSGTDRGYGSALLALRSISKEHYLEAIRQMENQTIATQPNQNSFRIYNSSFYQDYLSSWL